MQLVNSNEDVDKIRPYKSYNFTKYPKNYPALINFARCDGGFLGDYYSFEVIEIPKNVDSKSFIAGVLAVAKTYSELDFLEKKKK